MSSKDTHSLSPTQISLPEGTPVSIESWWRTHSATVALLKHAHGMVEEAEKKISEQEQRLRQLEEMASTDSLTGLMNRRGFETLFEHELARVHRRHSPGGVFVLIDLDLFKQINDLYGHQAGDACLSLVAGHLLKSIRTVDVAARFGGDEFALLLTQTDPDKAMLRIQKIRQTLNDMTLGWQGEKLHFGASLGIESVTADSTFETAYRTADAQLYADKKKRKSAKI